MRKFGKTITPYDANPQPHEIETAKFFNKLGKDAEFLAPNYAKGSKTADIKMDGILWEIKAPKGKGKYTFERAFKDAVRQSRNIILLAKINV